MSPEIYISSQLIDCLTTLPVGFRGGRLPETRAAGRPSLFWRMSAL
jgi:hypothetical protein